MRAFDAAVEGKDHAHLMREQLAKAAKQQMEVIAQHATHDEPFVYVPRQKEPRRRLGPFSMLRFVRDNIRLRKYNDEWIKANIK